MFLNKPNFYTYFEYKHIYKNTYAYMCICTRAVHLF